MLNLQTLVFLPNSLNKIYLFPFLAPSCHVHLQSIAQPAVQHCRRPAAHLRPLPFGKHRLLRFATNAWPYADHLPCSEITPPPPTTCITSTRDCRPLVPLVRLDEATKWSCLRLLVGQTHSAVGPRQNDRTPGRPNSQIHDTYTNSFPSPDFSSAQRPQSIDTYDAHG
jgi:hypothetical protein